MLGISTIWPSGVSSLVWFRPISRTVPEMPLASMKSPKAKGREERITSPPATLPRISSAARVMPRVRTDSRAVREEVLKPRASAVMMTVRTYSRVFTAVRISFCSRSLTFCIRFTSRVVIFIMSRTAIRQTSSVTRAERILARL